MCGSPIASLWAGSVETNTTRWLDINCYMCSSLNTIIIWRSWRRMRPSPLRKSSNPMDSSLPRSVSRARFELRKKGRRWIWKDTRHQSRKETEKTGRSHRHGGAVSHLSRRPELHLQFERSVKTLDVSERREVHLVLVELELQHRNTQTPSHDDKNSL